VGEMLTKAIRRDLWHLKNIQRLIMEDNRGLAEYSALGDSRQSRLAEYSALGCKWVNDPYWSRSDGELIDNNTVHSNHSQRFRANVVNRWDDKQCHVVSRARAQISYSSEVSILQN